MLYLWANEYNDYSRIDKLNSIKTLDGFYDAVRKYTAKTRSDHAIRRWECLSDIRYTEIELGYEFKGTGDYMEYINGKIDVSHKLNELFKSMGYYDKRLHPEWQAAYDAVIKAYKKKFSTERNKED